MGTSTDFAAPVTASRQLALDALLSRQSHWPLVEPAPNDVELNLVFDAALRAPDHGRLRPWRFVIVRDEAREDLGQALVEIAAKRNPDAPAETHEQRRRKAFAAPAIIVIAASVSTQTSVPEGEQLLSVGAATMNMLNALHILGYGGFWATGPDAYDADLHQVLDFEPNEKILGFLFVGSPPADAEVNPRAERADHVREWLGRLSI
ncbi:MULTISPECIES: nitroreductase family protein [Pandoraea]|uniref:Putative NAD(P)H nitroreductase n=1 Tax=Pandoraea norimbergensis TaxID=93219 RepID=A0ABN4JMP9_9BURK|nr:MULTISPECIES: nitroreductase [Pandoraea]ALS61676.1 nitroreductase [Pandoraea norimbergensis]